MSIYKKLTAQDIAVIPFNAHKQYDFTSGSASSNSINHFNTRWTSESIELYSSGSTTEYGLPADSINTIKYYQTDHLFYKNFKKDIGYRFGNKHYLNQKRDLYEKTNILSIPTGLYGHEIKPGTFSLLSNGREIVDDSNGNLIIDHRGTTNWTKLKGFNTNEDLVWDYKYGLYTKSKGHEMAVAYDELSLARSCDKLNIENLGYNCNELTKQTAPKALAVVDIEWDYSNNTKVSIANNSQVLIDKSKYQSIASNENFEDGDYELMWHWKIYDDDGKLEEDKYLGSDQATIKNGLLTFTKLNKSFEMENDIQSKNREKLNFKLEDGLILISANLDLASDGQTEPMAIVGSTSKDKDGNYYAEGVWVDNENIAIVFKMKN